MSYGFVDKFQNLFAQTFFSYPTDRKKAAERVLRKFTGIPFFYPLKSWGLEHFSATEQPLQEYANSNITHNIETPLRRRQKIWPNTLDRFSLSILFPLSITNRQTAKYLSEDMQASYARKSRPASLNKECSDGLLYCLLG